MGNSSSNSAEQMRHGSYQPAPSGQQGQQQQQAYAQPRVYAPPPPGGYQSNGGFLMQGVGYNPYGGHFGPPGPSFAAAPRAPLPYQPPPEFQATATIRNQVNLKKKSVKVQPLPESQELEVTFSFDATADCRVSVFTNARDEANCVTTQDMPVAVVPYAKGIDQKFPAVPASSSKLRLHTLPAATTQGWASMPPDQFALVVRLEALTEEGRAQGKSLDSVPPGGALPIWVQAQTTYARMQRQEDGSWTASNVTQKLWVQGSVFELQEIYGMEPGRPVEVADGIEDVEGNECVICMSAPRDTTALPCRHMSCCHTCANELKTQTDKCPICRNVISSLLHMKIAAPSNANSGTPLQAGAAGSSAH